MLVCSGKLADVYGLGATLYTLVCGRTPFTAASVPELFEKHQKEPLSFPDDLALDPDLRDLLTQMLAKVQAHWLAGSTALQQRC